MPSSTPDLPTEPVHVRQLTVAGGQLTAAVSRPDTTNPQAELRNPHGMQANDGVYLHKADLLNRLAVMIAAAEFAPPEIWDTSPMEAAKSTIAAFYAWLETRA